MDQSVMNLATVAARSSAIPTPTTGMVSYVGDTGSDSATNATIVNVPQIQAYTGAAWQNLDGLPLVAKATIGSGVANVTMSNVFSAAYENYKIIVSGGVASTTNSLLFNFEGNTANYYSSIIFSSWGGSAPAAAGSNNIAYWNEAGYGTTDNLNLHMDINNAFLAKNSTAAIHSTVNNAAGSTTLNKGFHNSATSFTGFRLVTNSGTITGGTIYVYGYRSA
jgi:hypothetical protein